MSNTDKMLRFRRKQYEMCPLCEGTGVIWNEAHTAEVKCYACNGSGRIETERVVKGHLIN